MLGRHDPVPRIRVRRCWSDIVESLCAATTIGEAGFRDSDSDLGDVRWTIGATGGALVPLANLHTLSDALVASERLPAFTEGPDRWRVPRITVTDDGRITTLNNPPPINVLSTLREIADAAEEDDDREYWLSVSSLRRAAKQGKSADRIVEMLEELLANPASDALTAIVRRWAKDWGRGAILPATILQLEQAQTLSDLLNDPETRSMLQRLPQAPTLAIVNPDAVDRLRQLLDERGMSLENTILR